MILSASAIAVELITESYLQVGPAQMRYLALPAYALGSAFLASDRGYLCSLAIFGLCWDLSSALFVGIKEGFSTHLPVPYWGKLDAEISGPPAWLPAAVDTAGVAFFGWLWHTKIDPLRIFSGSEGERDGRP